MSTPRNTSKLNPLSKPFVPSPPTTGGTANAGSQPMKKSGSSSKKAAPSRLLSDREYRELMEKEEEEQEERRALGAGRYAAAVERWAGFEGEEDFIPGDLPDK